MLERFKKISCILGFHTLVYHDIPPPLPQMSVVTVMCKICVFGQQTQNTCPLLRPSAFSYPITYLSFTLCLTYEAMDV